MKHEVHEELAGKSFLIELCDQKIFEIRLRGLRELRVYCFWQRTVPMSSRVLHVQLFRLLRALHDELEPRGRILPHQLVDDAIGDDLIRDLDA